MEIFCTQEKIRDIEKLVKYTKMYINNQPLPSPSLLSLNDNLYIYDGHTRFIAIVLSLKYKIENSIIGKFSKDVQNSALSMHIAHFAIYCSILKVDESYTKTPEIKCGFVTPFDLETEVRVSDFYPIKKYIIEHIKKTGDLSIIEKTSPLYKKKRTIRTIQELANLYEFVLERIKNEQNDNLAVLP